MTSVPVVDNIEMPMLGFGTFQLPQNQTGKLVSMALELGYNHFDCAYSYQNEAAIGEIFKNLKNRKGIYVVSKLWNTYHEPHRILPVFTTTLNNLQLEYLDMYLKDSDFLWYSKEWLNETWRAMVKLQESGRTKRIGVSNFTTKKLEWLMEQGPVPSNNQVELHPYLRQDQLVNFCKNNGITLSAYSPLGSPATPETFPGLVLPNSPVLLQDEIIAKVAKSHNATAAQVLLKWSVQRGIPAIVKSSNETRIRENFASLQLELSDTDMSTINGIATNCRYFTFNLILGDHTLEEFWDGEFFN